MANRYCNTTIWDKDWFLELSPIMKLFWKFFCDNCDHAGLWTISVRKLRTELDPNLTIEQIMEVPAFAERFKIIDDKLFCLGFIKYQYKSKLNKSNSVHRSVIQRLESVGINPYDLAPIKVLESSYQGSIDKDIEIDLDSSLKPQIEEILKSYPLQIGIDLGVTKLLPQIKSPQDLVDLKDAVLHFANYTRRMRTDEKFIIHPKRFADEWRTWVGEDAGSRPVSTNLQGVEMEKLREEIKANSTEEGLEKAMADPKLAKIASRFSGRRLEIN